MAEENKRILDVLNSDLSKIKIEGCNEENMHAFFIQMVTVQSSLVATNKELHVEDHIEMRTILMNSMTESLVLIKKQVLYKSWMTLNSCIDCVLNVVLECFTFCKSAGELVTIEYCHLSEKLSQLFKSTYQNMKCTIEVLEIFENNFGCNENVDLLAGTLSMFIKCSTELLTIDIMASAAVWKYVKRICLQNIDQISSNISKFLSLFDIIDITQFSLTLCLETLKQGESPALEKIQKIVRFFLGTTTQLTKDFKNTIPAESTGKLCELLLYIHRVTLAENKKHFRQLGCCKEFTNLENNVLCVLDLLVKEFIQITNCLQSVADFQDHICEEENKNFLFFLLNILEKLSDADEMMIGEWMISESTKNNKNERDGCHISIIDLIFDQSQDCADELFFCKKQQYIINGKSAEFSLYEYVLGKLCTFCSILPAKCFSSLETCLITFLSSESKYCRMMSIDLWCFVSRWGPSELCWSHVKLLGSLIINSSKFSLDQKVRSSFCQLFKRLFWFLDETYHELFLKEFPVCDSTVYVWSLVPLSHLRIERQIDVCSDIIKSVTFMLQEINEENDLHIVNGLTTVSNVIQNQEIYENIATSLKEALANEIVEFWMCFQNIVCDVEMSEHLMVAMLELTSHLIITLKSESIPKLLSMLETILANSDSVTFKLQMSDFLSQLKYSQFPQSMERECLYFITSIYQHLLNSHDWLVEDRAMTSLKEFAEVTVYSTSISKFLPADKKKDFSNFLKKLPHETDLNDEELLKHIYYEVNIKTKVEKEDEASEDENNEAKRRKLEREVEVEALLSRVEEAVSQLSKIPKKSRILSSCKRRLESIIALLHDLINDVDDDI